MNGPDKQRGNSKDEDPTGLLNEGFRYRDIETGVWLSRDPAGFVDGPNLYAYVKQNAWTAWDPHGLADEKEQKAVSAPQPTDDNHPLGAGYYTKATATTMSGLEISAKETKNKATAVLFDGSDVGSKDGELTSGKGFRAYAESITDPSRIFDMSKEGWEKDYLKVSKTIGGYDRTIIADHGWPGGQDAVDETLSGTSHKMKVIANGLKKKGMLVLGGCQTMRGPDGKTYAYELQHGVAEDKQLTIVGYTTGVNLPAHSIKVPGGQVTIPFDGAFQIKGVPQPPQAPMPLPPPQPLP